MNDAINNQSGNSPSERWTEEDSREFADRGDIFVPIRDVQIRTLCDLIPGEPDENFNVVELAAGDGTLAKAVLQRFPKCRYLALDGSEVMREKLRQVLSSFGDRVTIGHFDLEKFDWLDEISEPTRCVLASLVVHHIPGEDKRRLFSEIAGKLDAGGALLLADIVEPATPRIRNLFAQQWYDAVRKQSVEKTGDIEAYEFFRDDEWNFYDDDEPDPYERPSRLMDQLEWLKQVGFRIVDVFWMHAGHAIYGGFLAKVGRERQLERP